MKKLWFLPFACLVLLAGYIGLKLGQFPSETEIINRYAATYVAMAAQGAQLTDCAATSHAAAEIRMVIQCVHPNGVTTTYFVGPRGEAVAAPQEPAA